MMASVSEARTIYAEDVVAHLRDQYGSEAIPIYTKDVVAHMKKQYIDGSLYNSERLTAKVKTPIVLNGFIGSDNALCLISDMMITAEATACIAAPLVTMKAKEAISLGMAGKGKHPLPVRLFAPEVLTIITKHLSIGEIILGHERIKIDPPIDGSVSCKKITLSKSTEEDPDYFEIVKSWVVDDDTEIETIKKAFVPSSPQQDEDKVISLSTE